MQVDKLKSRAYRDLPLLLLALALLTVFLFGGDRGHFYRPGHHDWVSSEHMAKAANLSPEHRFLMFFYQFPDENGGSGYNVYNRRPIGSYAFIKLAILPLGDNLSAWLYAGRMVMLLFFAGAAAMAYLALCRLLSNRWAALGATLLAFSSYYLLYYNDMVASESMPSLFGMMLALHGMVVFMQEGRIRQMLVKACAALLLGWYVYALILPFVVFGLVSEIVRARPSFSGGWQDLKRLAVSVVRSPYLKLGVVASLFAFLILTFNLTNEYIALKGEYHLTELPTVRSVQGRIGASEEFNANYAEYLEWDVMLRYHFYRLRGLTLPHWLSSHFGNLYANPIPLSDLQGTVMVFTGTVISVICLVWALLSRFRILLVALAVSGFIWSLALRNAAIFHDFMIISSIGIPLIFYSLAMLCFRRLWGDRLVVVLGVAAALVFVVSAFQVSRISHDAESARFHEAIIADFVRIRQVTEPGDRIFVPVPYRPSPYQQISFGGARRAVNFYLTGRLIGYQKKDEHNLSDYDFVLARPTLVDPGLSFTPENRLRFLYRPEDYSASLLRERVENIGETDPVIRSVYDVYLRDGRLTFLKDGCDHDDIRRRFLLHLIPVKVDDLPEHRRQHGFDNLDFDFSSHRHFYTHSGFNFSTHGFYTHSVRFDGKCLAQVILPNYDIAKIAVGQYFKENGDFINIWLEEFQPPK